MMELGTHENIDALIKQVKKHICSTLKNTPVLKKYDSKKTAVTNGLQQFKKLFGETITRICG